MGTFTVAACQMDSRADKAANVETALSLLDDAAARGADVAALPEMFTFMGEKDEYRENAETVPGDVTDALADAAREHDMYVHGGSMYEVAEEPGKVYNTTVVIDPDGEIRETYRKVHLFDVTIGEEVDTQESERVAAGDEAKTVETDLATFGLSICYDLRFPGLFSTLSGQGAEVIFMPAAFTRHTGKDHWAPLLRARAIENQAYVVAPGQFGDKGPDGVATYGRSLVIDPWGTVVARASDRETIVTAEVDLDHLDTIRRELPSLEHERPDVYE